MELYQYLFKNKITQKELAEILNFQPHNMHRLVHGKASASLKTAVAIHELTDGDVSYKDLLSEKDIGVLQNIGAV